MTPDLYALIRRHPVWRESPLHLVRELSRRGRLEQHATGGLLIKSGRLADDIHLLLEGHVRVFYVSANAEREVTVKIIKAPAVFGESESILQLKRVTNVQALVPSSVIVFPSEHYFRVLRQCPEACFRQFFDLGRRFGLAMRTERQAQVAELEERLLTLFSSYADAFGHALPDGTVRIEHHVDQLSLATALGSTPRTVTRALSSLYKKNLLVRRGRDFVVPSVERLNAAATDEASSFAYSLTLPDRVLHARQSTDAE